ncbi:MAG: tRNA (N(6)-L-threonylcarbamoyladenosine(37)-C(2))-methylthiotransferase MtaB [Tannerella sp.]|jgi:threonylcarbamoyladenosine tRNA methylthiotransferase MtaB|nr:tRNA (N(6)-L-threonylcarbamoyladenosine(37)-C(2))-methylthiotransferase MtaB [Tannerella sp.]
MTDSNIFENRIAAYYTLGCKLNFAETSAIGKELARCGFRKAGAGEQADICVINTCSVTELADRKCRQLIRRIHRLHPKAFIVATGCYAQLKPDAVSRIDGVNLVLGNAQKAHIMQYIDKMTETRAVVTSPAKEMQAFVPSCSAGDRTRHFLKVQDGCDYFCSYCTIPFARGRSRNGSIDEMVAQAAQVARDGGKEIVLTGVNIGDFGKSTGETFIDLLRALDSVDSGIARYRISSVEPNLITDEIIDFVAKSKLFAPHFHIPLQSGSDGTLQLMRRRYDTKLFRHRVERINAMIPGAFIGVDIIVGARGETESRFEESYAFVEQLPVSQLHVFHYSERPGTQALEIRPAVPPAIRQLRSKRLLELSDLKWRQFYESQIGQTAETLFEHTRRGKMMHGFTANYVRTEAPYRTDAVNRISRVRLNGWNAGGTALACTFID